MSVSALLAQAGPRPTGTLSLGDPKVIAIIAYAILVVVIGVLGSRRMQSFKDFLLGGGKVGAWMTAFSFGTAYFSAVLFIGFAGKIGWSFGLSGLWVAVGNTLIGVLAVWYFLGRRIRGTALRLNAHTMPEFLHARYQSPALKGLTAGAIFLFFIPYTAAVFMGLTYLFEVTFGIQYVYVLLFMGVFTGIYMILGGYRAMAMLDIIFGVIMTVGVVTLLYFAVDGAGGIGVIGDKLNAIDPKLTAPVGPPGILALGSLVFLTSVAPFAMPQLIQKFYAIKDDRSVKIGMWASTFFAVLVTGTAYFVGALTRVFISAETHPNAFPDGSVKFDALMPEIINTVIPEWLIVVMLLLILSASMSTLAALVLISSSALTKDLYHGFIKRDASDRSLTRIMRAGSGFFILLSMVLAYTEPGIILTVMAISWGAVGAVFLGPFVWGIFSKRMSRTGAYAGAIGGLAVNLVAFAAFHRSAPEAGAYGMIASLVLVPLVSAFTSATEAQPLGEEEVKPHVYLDAGAAGDETKAGEAL